MVAKITVHDATTVFLDRVIAYAYLRQAQYQKEQEQKQKKKQEKQEKQEKQPGDFERLTKELPRQIFQSAQDIIDKNEQLKPWSGYISQTDLEDIVLAVLDHVQTCVETKEAPQDPEPSLFIDFHLTNSVKSVLYALSDRQSKEPDLIYELIKEVLTQLDKIPQKDKNFVSSINDILPLVESMYSQERYTHLYTNRKNLKHLSDVIHDTFRYFYSTPLTQEEQNAMIESKVDEYLYEIKMLYHTKTKKYLTQKLTYELFKEVKDFDIEIGQYYYWSVLASTHLQANDILDYYASAVQRGVLKKPAKCTLTPKRSTTLAKQEALRIAENGQKFDPRQKRLPFKELFFNTHQTDVLIEKKSIQNSFVLALSYDTPTNQIDYLLKQYKQIFELLKADYVAKFKEEESEDSMSKNEDALAYEENFVLDNISGSILTHICALLAFELKCEKEFAEKAFKVILIEVLDRIKEAGFTISDTSVENAYYNRRKTVCQIKEIFDQLR